MYSYDTRVSFSRVDTDEKLTLNSLIEYFQDASTFHSEDLGVGFSYLRPKKLIWVINTWQIDIIRMPSYLEKIKVCTIPYKFRGFLGYRNFYIEDADGEKIVKANSLWSLVNYETMKPEKAPEELPGIYGDADPIDMDYCSGKLRLPENTVSHNMIKVEKHFLDPNHHMNNGQYINIALSCIPEGLKIKRLRAEYRKQAFLGNELHPVSGDNGAGVWTVSINDNDGKPYSVVEFTAEGSL